MLAGALVSAALAASAHAETIPVFVSILPQKYFVERIAGDRAEVFVMVGPGDSPATYEPRPRQVAALSRARVYFEIGVPFEAVWAPRLAAAHPDLLFVDTAAKIARRPADAPAGATGEAAVMSDPHLWTDPALVKIMAARIRDAFLELDPAHTDGYERNYRDFAADLDALEDRIRARLSPYAGRSFLVFHAAWGYFADAFGLRQIPIEAEGKEPGPKTLAHVIDEARTLGIKVIFVQPQFSRQDAQMIAREIGGTVIAVDPLAENYLDNIESVAAALADAMGPP